MKSYTFKVKTFDEEADCYVSILSIHMPTEAFFESVKATPHLKAFSDKNPKSIVTCSDYFYYVDNDVKRYITEDLYFCDLSTMVNAKSFKEFLIDDNVAGTLPEYPIPKEDDASYPLDAKFDDVYEVVNNEQVNSI